MFDSQNYLLRSERNCSSQNMMSTQSTNYIVICVCSAIANFRTRQVIRETWGSQKTVEKFRIVLLFFVGTTSNIDHQRALNNESILHDDLIQTDFKDTYRNLTLKSVSMIRWVSDSCPNATYVVKIDDDCFLNLPFLIKEVSKMKRKQGVLIGYLLKYVRPVRDVKSKYHVSSSDYHWKIYPNYLSGSCYVMSGELVPTMFEKCQGQLFMPMEDIFITGICAKRIGVAPTHNTHFVHWKLPSNGCDYREKIMGHFVTIADLIKVWTDMVKLTSKSYKCVLKPRIISKSRRHKK